MDKSKVANRLKGIVPLPKVAALPPGLSRKSAPGSSVQVTELLPGNRPGAASDVQALENAGWTFAEPSPDTADDAFQVLLDSDGRVKLSGKALIVRLRKHMTEAAIREMLAKHGLQIRRSLGFAENTFVVEGKPGAALDSARRLNEDDLVDYAEPVMVEAISGRRDGSR